jgi:hypothetical protein
VEEGKGQGRRTVVLAAAAAWKGIGGGGDARIGKRRLGFSLRAALFSASFPGFLVPYSAESAYRAFFTGMGLWQGHLAGLRQSARCIFGLRCSAVSGWQIVWLGED